MEKVGVAWNLAPGEAASGTKIPMFPLKMTDTLPGNPLTWRESGNLL